MGLFNRLHYVQDNDQHTSGLWSVSDVLDLGQLRRHKTRLSIRNLPLASSQQDLCRSLLDPVLTEHLVSLQLAKPMPPLTTRVDTLKRLLVQCRSLETLEYEDLGRGTSFAFAPGAAERLPPVSKLVLKSYDWTHSADEVARHWNLSELRSLTLVSVPVSQFLRSVQPRHLRRLTCLRVHDGPVSGPDRQEDATRRLHQLVRNHISALQVLDLTCHTRLFPIDAITRHGASLREVRLADHIGFGHDDDDRCPTLSPDDVAVLGGSLPLVHTLELDMDAGLCSPRDFLHALSTFPRLQHLTLHVQTLLRAGDPDGDPDGDGDYEAALWTFSRLMRQRDGSDARVPWRRVTVNVGGWRRVMLRRVGSEWRRKNARGLFAERCFVLQRDGAGEYHVREETCHDARQYMPTL
ncbi:hypothetical protein E4U42_005798 [Claviceps africana]|uniref:Uncharacterized protein n=1 Tax=Claviceps africana TaxID=83212 RepID=A0A8K0NG50_9HYPO|nr:hypothetical protein E4U42_005798 [Claviceps africana]